MAPTHLEVRDDAAGNFMMLEEGQEVLLHEEGFLDAFADDVRAAVRRVVGWFELVRYEGFGSVLRQRDHLLSEFQMCGGDDQRVLTARRSEPMNRKADARMRRTRIATRQSAVL